MSSKFKKKKTLIRRCLSGIKVGRDDVVNSIIVGLAYGDICIKTSILGLLGLVKGDKIA